MGLSDRLGKKRPKTPSPREGFTQTSDRDLSAIAARLHRQILDRLDLAAVSSLSPEEVRDRLQAIVEQLVAGEHLVVTEDEQAAIVGSVLDELVGLGPIEQLLNDPTISDVLVNGSGNVYVERHGKLELVDVHFRDEQHLFHTIQRIVARVGRRIDESSPMVDARLPDGSRINAIIPPLAVDGAALSIRRFGSNRLSGEDLVESRALSTDMLAYLQVAVQSRCTILIAGGTGAGKTTLLNVLSGFIPAGERIITIEDAAELRLQQRHVVRLEARPANLEGKGEVSIRDLVKNALRMRPDRIVVGEVRGAEVFDMLQAMNTGHEGSLATVHANSPKDAIGRLMTMLGMAGTGLAEETMATLIARAIDIVVHVSRMRDGRRRITGISEVTDQVGSQIEMHPVFVFQRTGTGTAGAIRGQHVHVGATTLEERFRSVD